ncbi:MAG TPA: tetratricopeptide repeat protein [Gemmataceae bacterium]|nr:tetratricopeptide repeat protein [Gemmataceae bacterium]
MAADTVDALCMKAREAIAQRNPDRARQLYLQALGLKSDAPDVHYGLATVCFQLKDLHSAAHHFREVTRLDPLRAGAFINLGAVYNLLDQLDDSITMLRRGIQLDSRRAEGYYNLALVYRRKGQVDMAIQAYREALRVNPQMSDAHYNLGNVFVEKGQYGMAATHYKHALQLRPNWDKATAGLAEVEAHLNQAKAPADPKADSGTVPLRQPQMDMERTVDPNSQGELLTVVHKATIESEEFGRQFLQVLENEIEPAIKELSSSLLYPDTSAGELDQCVEKFESAMARLRSVQKTVSLSVERVNALGEKLFK